MKLSKKLFESLDANISINGGKAHFHFSIDELEYNKIMKTTTRVKKPTTSKAPAWAVPLLADISLIKGKVQNIENRLDVIEDKLDRNKIY